MGFLDFIFGTKSNNNKPISNLEYDIINNDNESGLFPENDEEICDNCGEFLEDCECENRRQSREDAGLDYDEIDELEDMEENDFDDEIDW